MIHDIVIPSAGESITSAEIARWYKNDGVWVEEGELLVSLETDKVSNDLHAPASGSLKILVKEGEEVSIGTVIGRLDDEVLRSDVKSSHDKVLQEVSSVENVQQPVSPVSAPPVIAHKEDKIVKELPSQKEARTAAPELFSKKPLGAPPPNAMAALAAAAEAVKTPPVQSVSSPEASFVLTSMGGTAEKKEEPVVIPPAPAPKPAPAPVQETPAPKPVLPVEPVAPVQPATSPVPNTPAPVSNVSYGLSEDGRTERVKMTPLRRKVAAQLLSVQSESAILSTFNECDMSAVMKLRKSLQEDFVKRHGVKLGFMSFFIKAVVNALKAVPEINAQIDGNDIVKKHFYDISVAVGTEKGLVVPVIRDCDKKTFGEIEQELAELAEKARTGKITMPDLQGGVFTISNGGVYGSLLSTPIINPPQSGILGLHSIKERPIAEDGQVVIRPMMYLALSYDHRLVDGKQAVSFLVRVKECIEDPTLLLLDA